MQFQNCAVHFEIAGVIADLDCPSGQNPLVHGFHPPDKIRQRNLSLGTRSANGFCPGGHYSLADHVPSPPFPSCLCVYLASACRQPDLNTTASLFTRKKSRHTTSMTTLLAGKQAGSCIHHHSMHKAPAVAEARLERL